MDVKHKLAIIGTVGLPANYGGFETLTEQLVRNLSDQFDMTVYCSGKRYPSNVRQSHFMSARLKYLPLKANGIQSILYDTLSILHALRYADVLLVLGVAGAWILPFVRWFTNKKIIVSIDGIEWKRGKWNLLAKWYLFWAEGLAVKYSHIDISDNESIQDYTAMRYGSLSRVIEYGADHTIKVVPDAEDFKEFPFLRQPYAFKVCRIEPENNVHVVLETFSKLSKHSLVIVGNWENSAYGKELKIQYGHFPNIILLDPIYNQRKLDVIRGNALLYIHGHSAGGTNPSLVEAMYLGLPIITFGVTYNLTTTEHRALYFKDEKGLTALIQNTSVKKLKTLGRIMESIAVRRYNWKLIARNYNALFLEALNCKHKNIVQPATAIIEEEELLQLEAGHLRHQQLFFEKR